MYNFAGDSMLSQNMGELVDTPSFTTYEGGWVLVRVYTLHYCTVPRLPQH